MDPRPVVLVIRDGWGYPDRQAPGYAPRGDATALANTPVNDHLQATCPWTLLECSGEVVGLPEGQMGNSEVGHLNLGAGQIVDQDITRINKAIRDGSFHRNPVLASLADRVAEREGQVHLIGLCSDGGVHSHIQHLHALLDFFGPRDLTVALHLITDGRDTSPTGGMEYVASIEERIGAMPNVFIATVTGRYYAMDRDRRWPRTQVAFQAMVRAEGEATGDIQEMLAGHYAEGVTDEFIPPTVCAGPPRFRGIEPRDGVIFFNFRADRLRQFAAPFVQPDFGEFAGLILDPGHFVTFTQIWDAVSNPVVFPPRKVTNVLADVLARHGLRQLRAAETEKYAHVTYFFNGGREEPVEGELRDLVPSPKVSTYDLAPEMSAQELTDRTLRHFEDERPSFTLINYANPDMVGHTGDIAAATRAVAFVDVCVGRLMEGVRRMGGVALITADHGNAEQMLDVNGLPFTAHTLNPVQIFLAGEGIEPGTRLHPGILADVAPTVLALLGIEQPVEMTGRSLLEGD